MNSTDTVPTFSKLIIPIIDVLNSIGGTGTNRQITEGLLAKGFIQGSMRGNQSELEYRSAWARTYLKAYGGLLNPQKGQWQLTDMGRAITKDQVSNVVNTVARKSRAVRKEKAKDKAKSKAAAQSKRKATSARREGKTSSGEVPHLDHAKIIISLLEKGILNKASANEAIRKLGGV